MDKRWRNLTLILIVIIFIFLGLFILNSGFLNDLTFSNEQKSLDDGYNEILNLFEKNDVNLTNLQTLNLVYIENDRVKFNENKSNLINLKNDLINFNNNAKNNFSEFTELEEISSLFISTIDYSLNLEKSLQKIILLTNDSENLSCSNYSHLDEILLEMSDVYMSVENLYNKSIEFSKKYDVFSSPLVINLDAEYEDYLFVEDLVVYIKDYCEGELL